MKRLICSIGLLLLAVCVVMPSVTLADAGHARIVRLSLIQGDVRYARSFHDDPLAEGNATWEQAALNLPLREGYVLATGSGRAAVEFESGAMAFLSGNTVLEFYDLSLHDGGRITRLVLRQGSASFYVNPANGDYFSVTGGDFTVEANGRTTFRMDNFDDGSSMKVLKGTVAVLRKEHSSTLGKGQSASMHAGSTDDMVVVGNAGENDDFDRWVSGRIESEVAALNSSTQFVNSPYYTAGFADLYTYGSWFSMGGFGNCWRPFGAGLGWSPFAFGDWYMDASFGPTFIGSAQWGWLPYHYGGWISSPMYGWCWNPVGFGFSRPVKWHPVTAVWVHTGTRVGLVPLHPLDKRGNTPVNIGKGVYPVQGREVGQPLAIAGTEKWTVAKQAPKGTLTGGLVTTSAAPPRVSRTLYAGNTTGRATTVGSSITYDPQEHRFVNANNPPNRAIASNEVKPPTAIMGKDLPPNARVIQPGRTTSAPAVPRASLPPRAAITPAPARTSGGGSSRSSSGSSGGGTWGGSRGSGGSSGSSSSSSSSSHPSGGGSGGGGAHPR